MDRRSKEISQAVEWVLPLGVCCAESQADGVPCSEQNGDCLQCERADPVRQVLLRLAAAQAARPMPTH
jgi:hypothetical protein